MNSERDVFMQNIARFSSNADFLINSQSIFFSNENHKWISLKNSSTRNEFVLFFFHVKLNPRTNFDYNKYYIFSSYEYVKYETNFNKQFNLLICPGASRLPLSQSMSTETRMVAKKTVNVARR